VTTLYVLGSGSRGNCCAIESEGVALLIDAGFSAREVERRAEQAGLALSSVAGIVLTHEHGDHASSALRLAARLDVPVLTSPGTWQQLAAAPAIAHHPLGMCLSVELGPFTVQACATSHDAAEPIAVAVQAADGTSVGVAYDLGRPTAAVRYLLRDLTALVLEANHDDVLLRTSGYPPSVQRRIAGAGGHLSNRAAADLIGELHHPGLSAIVLAHLSQRCNSAEHARAAVAPVLTRSYFVGTLHIAAQDEPLPPIAVARRTRGQLQLAL
jgi:phosphoribosyl 1,2-cyclic phosphodiesterase